MEEEESKDHVGPLIPSSEMQKGRFGLTRARSEHDTAAADYFGSGVAVG